MRSPNSARPGRLPGLGWLAIDAREQLSGKIEPLLRRQCEGFFEDLERRYGHGSMLTWPAHAAPARAGARSILAQLGQGVLELLVLAGGVAGLEALADQADD